MGLNMNLLLLLHFFNINTFYSFRKLLWFKFLAIVVTITFPILEGCFSSLLFVFPPIRYHCRCLPYPWRLCFIVACLLHLFSLLLILLLLLKLYGYLGSFFCVVIAHCFLLIALILLLLSLLMFALTSTSGRDIGVLLFVDVWNV